MKPFRQIVVYIEYRSDAGGGVPDSRLLCGRVVETVTARGGVCRAFGDELIAPRNITDRHMHSAHTVCLAELRGLTEEVLFRYHPLLNLEPERYPVKGSA